MGLEKRWNLAPKFRSNLSPMAKIITVLKANKSSNFLIKLKLEVVKFANYDVAVIFEYFRLHVSSR